ncbi:Piso0_005130 [Millerozyma farinosa CBS 7064]|uniref:Piso0_005130 protein n=1 Tax=Pichia sorbitophila (strain ATCC MYA-4447 / BCRC 22081 / CBS 7064 / NBRC 10061 / NRRL Y-12695) TaxID=559304 RepID=G8Y4A9_PICSO|nr:Piso0_005130 [Millerozyma farinosa CBS 7064]
MNNTDILVAHVGAGRHSTLKAKSYRKLLYEALAYDEIQEVGEILEKNALTNTGYGSALDYNGEVNCDCSFIINWNGQISSGSAYNVSHDTPIRTTIELYQKLDEVYRNKLGRFGLNKPVLLDYGDNTLRSMIGLEEGPHKSLVSPQTRKIYALYKTRLDNDESLALEALPDVQDTIGIISIQRSQSSIASSSGGNFFKLPGRIGCAGVIGAALYRLERNNKEVYCLCSGNGEDILTMQLASTVSRSLLEAEDDYSDVMVNSIMQRKSDLPSYSPESSEFCVPYVGVVCLVRDLSLEETTLLYCHSTESFYFGFKSQRGKEVVLSTHDPKKVGKSFVRGEYRL